MMPEKEKTMPEFEVIDRIEDAINDACMSNCCIVFVFAFAISLPFIGLILALVLK